MPYDPDLHHRRSVRLRGYDYTRTGAYFVTICAHGRECLFGEMRANVMHLGPLGEIATAAWQDIPRHFPAVEIDAMVVMPNHLHGIIMLAETNLGAKHFPLENASPLQQTGNPRGTHPGSLAAIIQNYKSIAARKINAVRGAPGARVWQRNYYEHIVRDEADLRRIREYVEHNPATWAKDPLFGP